MAIKFKGSQATGASYRIGSGIPLDERLVVSSYSDLFNENTFLFVNKQNDVTDTQTAYLGMVVAVVEDADTSKNGLYLLTASPSTIESNWKKVGSDFNPEDINTGIQELMITCTFNELTSLVNTLKLIPGMKYRITDYTHMLMTNINTSYKSTILLETHGAVVKDGIGAFDVVVTATSNNTLSPDAQLIAKNVPGMSRDYSKFNVKYEIYNGITSSNKYKYIKSNVVCGVIYYMKDEFGNEADYDFINIQYFNEITNQYHYTFDNYYNNAHGSAKGLFRNNVIKSSSKYDLPFVIYHFDGNAVNHQGNSMSQYGTLLNDVQITHSSNIILNNVILSNSIIDKSHNIKINFDTTNDSGDILENIAPEFNNLQIRSNSGLMLSESMDNLANLDMDLEGHIYLENVNIMPFRTQEASLSRRIVFSQLVSNIFNIIYDGILQSGIISKNPDKYGDFLNSIQSATDQGVFTYVFHNSYSQYVSAEEQFLDSMITSSLKNITYSIFDCDNLTPYIVDIPQFSTSTTSVVELGLN